MMWLMEKSYDLTSLRLFVAVCEAKSITHAADMEAIAASAVSKRIAKLEQLAGTRLLVRSRSGVVPTKAGATLLEHARNLIYNLDLIDRDLSKSAKENPSRIRIFASASAIAEFLAAAVTRFIANPRNAHIDFQLEEMVSNEVVAGVKDGLAVLGVCWADADMSGLDVLPAGSDELALIVPTGHALAGRRQVRFADTLAYEHAGLRPSSAVTTLLRRECSRSGKVLRCRALVSTFEAAISVVSAGLAISVVPAQVAVRYQEAAGIRVIPLNEPWAHRKFAVCCRNRKTLARPVATFVRHLLVERREQPESELGASANEMAPPKR
jgi:DNA-binding transcriptional LysR family regulator